MGVLAAIAALFPWELGEKADPFAPAYQDIRPEWYFVFMFQTLKLVPGGQILGIEYEAIPDSLVRSRWNGHAPRTVSRPSDRKGRSKPLVYGHWRGCSCLYGGNDGLGLQLLGAGLGGVRHGRHDRDPGLGHETRGERRMSRDTSWVLGVVFVVALLHASAPVSASQQGDGTEPESAQPTNASESRDATSCVLCHGDGDLFEQEQLQIVQEYREGVHAEAGLSCHDCHGGNPDPAIADDMDAAMDESYKSNPYLGVPDATAVPGYCGRCHSSPEYMRRFNPNARVDQEREYWTSQHGLLLKSGDANVATCSSCHGVHGILAADNPRSSVYPTHVAETCRGCHGDAERMADYELPNGLPLPIDQYERWRESVHAAAMLEREDLSAPTCNDCHGNHGAMPPGVQSIAYVCGECHGREADCFARAPRGRVSRPTTSCSPTQVPTVAPIVIRTRSRRPRLPTCSR